MRIVEAIALGLVLTVPLAAFACSSSETNGVPADAGTDMQIDSEPPPEQDAGIDVEQPPDIYPSKHADIPQLDDLGGPVLNHMKLVTVTFYHSNPDAGAPGDGGDGGPAHIPDPLRDSLRSFDDFIVKSDWWHQTMSGFKVGDGTGGLYGELEDTHVAGQTITDDDIQLLLQSGVDSGELPPPEPQILYALYFPASTRITNFGSAACADFLGYHFEMYIVYNETPVRVAYAVMPRCSAATPTDVKDQLTVTASHEFAEAASDPYPSTDGTYRLVTNDAWVPTLGLGSAGNENGDVCIFAPNYDESGWKVQPIWSNKAASESREPCQPQPINASPIYFNAAVRTEKRKIGGRMTYGYLMLNPGGSVDAIIDFFSTAKLPKNVKLFVGRDKGGGDPTDMKEIANGLTAELSSNEAHNGNGIIMTLKAPANAVKGEFRFVVRSVLSQDDFHDWPVIARVQAP